MWMPWSAMCWRRAGRGAGSTDQSAQAPGFKQGGLVQLASGRAGQAGDEPLLDELDGHAGPLRGEERKALAPRARVWLPSICQRESPGAHLINSTVSGRTDRIPMRARTGCFVIPADVVSGLGEGNTMAGAKMWGDLLTHSVTGAAAAGMQARCCACAEGWYRTHGRDQGPGSRQLPAPKPIVAPPQKVPYQNLPTSVPKGYADGGFMSGRR